MVKDLVVLLATTLALVLPALVGLAVPLPTLPLPTPTLLPPPPPPAFFGGTAGFVVEDDEDVGGGGVGVDVVVGGGVEGLREGDAK